MSGIESLKEKLARKIKQAAKKQQDIQPKIQQELNKPIQHPQKQEADDRKIDKFINRVQKGMNFHQDSQDQDNIYDYNRQPNLGRKMQRRDEIDEQMPDDRILFGGDFPTGKNQMMMEEQNPQLRKQFLQKKEAEEAWLKPRLEPFIVQGLHQNNNEQEIQKQIESMLRQPQQLAANQAITTNHEEDEESQKYKQLMLNTIKNKNKTKHKRRPEDKPTPFQKLSPPYQQIKIFASYLPRYQQRRNRQLFGNTVDLGVRTLHQVVLQCYLQGIISKDVLLSIDKMGVQKQLQFIKKFAENKLNQYEFKTVKFTPLDYRRLCTILIMHNKDKYTMGERIYSVFKEITDFYHVIYNMNQQQYNRLSNSIILTHKLTWWNQILKRQQSAFQNQNQNLDTSTIYQPPLSPLFGADINDPENDFYKAKKKHYPNRVSQAKLRRNSTPSSRLDDQNSITDKNISKDMSGFPIIQQQAENSSYSQDNTKKNQSEFSERPSFNNSSSDENDESQLSSMSKSKIRRRYNDKSISMISESNLNTHKEMVSSINSSRYDQSQQKSDSIGMSQSISEQQQQEEDSSILDSISISSMALRKKRNKKKVAKSKRNRPKSLKNLIKKKNDLDISVQGSVSDNDRHDVFLQSSQEQNMLPGKKRQK